VTLPTESHQGPFAGGAGGIHADGIGGLRQNEPSFKGARWAWASSSPRSQLNRILDDRRRAPRVTAEVLKEGRAPRPRNWSPRRSLGANIQQAFVFDTARHFASRFSQPRILCVGSYEDSAAAGHEGRRLRGRRESIPSSTK